MYFIYAKGLKGCWSFLFHYFCSYYDYEARSSAVSIFGMLRIQECQFPHYSPSTATLWTETCSAGGVSVECVEESLNVC